jgi:hypothetical protein
MDDETLKEILGRLGDFYKTMKPGKDCPPDDMLLDYVYNDLSEEEQEEVIQHIKLCERCGFEVIELEADRDGWQHAVNKDPDAMLVKALGKEGFEKVQRLVPEWKGIASTHSTGKVASARHRKENFLILDQDIIDRIAGAAAAEVLDNVDLHMAYWKKTRGQLHFGQDMGLAQATGLGGDILPSIADAIRQAWEWCIGNRSTIVAGVLNSALVTYVSSIFQKSKGSTRLSDKEIEVLVDVIARKVVEAITQATGSTTDG